MHAWVDTQRRQQLDSLGPDRARVVGLDREGQDGRDVESAGLGQGRHAQLDEEDALREAACL